MLRIKMLLFESSQHLKTEHDFSNNQQIGFRFRTVAVMMIFLNSGLKRHEKSDGSFTCLCADEKTEAYANGTCPATTSSGTGMPLMCDAGSQVN